MVASPLVDAKIEAGRLLLDKLATENLSIEAAFWLLEEDSLDWRLVIATPLAQYVGPREVYRRIQAALLGEESDDLNLFNVSVVSMQDARAQAVRTGVTMATGSGARLHKTSISGQYFEDAYVYGV